MKHWTECHPTILIQVMKVSSFFNFIIHELHSWKLGEKNANIYWFRPVLISKNICLALCYLRIVCIVKKLEINPAQDCFHLNKSKFPMNI